MAGEHIMSGVDGFILLLPAMMAAWALGDIGRALKEIARKMPEPDTLKAQSDPETEQGGKDAV